MSDLNFIHNFIKNAEGADFRYFSSTDQLFLSDSKLLILSSKNAFGLPILFAIDKKKGEEIHLTIPQKEEIQTLTEHRYKITRSNQ